MTQTNEQQDGLSLALGGMSTGPTVLDMAAAYATIANYGEYIEPTFYSKITDAEGNEIHCETTKKEEEYYQNKMLGYCKHYYKNQQEQV